MTAMHVILQSTKLNRVVVANMTELNIFSYFFSSKLEIIALCMSYKNSFIKVLYEILLRYVLTILTGKMSTNPVL